MKTKNEIPKNGDVRYIPEFIGKTESVQFMDQLRKEIKWRQEPIVVFGKRVDQPRLIAWYGNKNLPYSYSQLNLLATPWNSLLQKLKQLVEVYAQTTFNGVLLNFYRDGHDYAGWHSDNEKVLGPEPFIASLSFGVTRDFLLRHKTEKGLQVKIILEPGSLLLMKGQTQTHWQHSLPKRLKIKEPRINLTFRAIFSENSTTRGYSSYHKRPSNNNV